MFASHVPSSHALSVQPTDNQLMFSQEDTKLWQWPYCHQAQQQQNIAQLSEEHAALVPTRTEQLPRDVQQSMLTAIVSQHIPVNGSLAYRTEAVLPAPVRDIYQRLADKQQQVTSMSSNTEDVSQLLNNVQRGELLECYVSATTQSSDNESDEQHLLRMCTIDFLFRLSFGLVVEKNS